MFGCEYCHGIGRHDPRCPLALDPKTNHCCFICGEGIYDGDEYVKNDNGEFAHYDCPTSREMVEFLGYKIEAMESEDKRY